MSASRKTTTVISFDPGGRTGWSIFQVNSQAFTKESERILRNIVTHQYGEFEGEENEQIRDAVNLVKQSLPLFSHSHNGPDTDLHVVTEDFTLMQMTGGKELLSPVRINAALDFTLWKMDVPLRYQPRSLRIGVTRERLKRWLKKTVKGKDAFAAVQHGIVYMRRLKQKGVTV